MGEDGRLLSVLAPALCPSLAVQASGASQTHDHWMVNNPDAALICW
jgi:hypothetical protein